MLARGEIQLVGATTLNEYRKFIEKDAALERRFSPVTVNEPSEKDTIQILKGIRDKYEAHHNVKITDEAIEAAVNLSVIYVNDRFLPDKAIDLIDEASSRARLKTYTEPDSLKELQEEIEQKVNDETWLTGEEAAELFDIKVEEANDAVACAGSSMFFCYKNVPTSLTAQGKNAKKKDEQRPLSRQDIKEIFNESFSEYQAREKEKKELLESLNKYGERKQNG